MSGAEAHTGWWPESALPCRNVVHQDSVMCGVALVGEHVHRDAWHEGASRAAHLEPKQRRGGNVAVKCVKRDVRGRAGENVPDSVLCLRRLSNTRRSTARTFQRQYRTT